MTNALEELRKVLLEASNAQKKKEVLIEIKEEPLVGEESIAQKTARFLNTNNDNVPAAPQDIESQRWNDPLRKDPGEKFVTFKEMNDHYGLFLQRIQKQMSTISGGGEVNLRNLDDVDRSTIGPNRHLAYNPTTKKFFFEDVTSGEPQVQSDWNISDTENVAFIKNKPLNLSDFNNDEGFITTADGGNASLLDGQLGSYYLDYSNFTNTPLSLEGDGFTTAIANNAISVTNLPQDTLIGPIDSLRFDVNHDHTEDRVEETLCWDPDDRTVNIVHPGGVVQQVGQETFIKIRNETGSLIEDGTVVRFDGASLNGGAARLEAAPFFGGWIIS